MAAGPEGVPGVCGSEEGSETPGTPPGSPAELPRVRRQRGRFLLWSPRAARALRERQRVWGALVGTPQRRGRAGAAGPRLPLQLRPEEARALRESGGATVEAVDEAEAEPEETPAEPSPPSERRFRVFRELWGRGLHLTPGGKFGGDFLVYPGPPSQFHAGAVALCPCSSAPQPLGALLAAARLGTSVRKALLLCRAPPGGALACTALTWRADLT
ncbi:tRNA-splicing endonuclease subunit Sen34 [Catharus ustulatus]|uniref:tRNA-splicing endonuclease subunit Sen34 n=1 Tax=Catharus ustulatus TaxID=91951 RepID=UPI00140C110E|nr:tRNA-splicing endonuclease subunit Sen34 [Catharus ustulatus]